VFGVATEDMDALTFGTPRLIRHLMHSGVSARMLLSAAARCRSVVCAGLDWGAGVGPQVEGGARQCACTLGCWRALACV